MNRSNEWWKVNPKFPNYEISSFGRVRRTKKYHNSCNKDGLIKIIPYGKFGYMGVSVSENNVSRRILLHRLVIETFLGECPDGYEVNHIDGKKGNNSIDNLEFVTRSGNIDHAKSLGLYIAPNKGKKTGIVPRSAFKKGNIPWNKIAALTQSESK